MRIERAGYRSLARLVASAALLGFGATAALAAGVGQPEPWQIDMQVPVTDLARGAYRFHQWINWIIVAIVLFVAGLLAAVMIKFNHRAHPTPSRTTHNTMLEVAWTIVPVLILVAIAIPSFRLLRAQLIIPKGDIVVKAIGHAWYWEYEYPADQGGFKFDSNMLETKDIKPGQTRLLAVDNEMVVPAGKIVRMQTTAADVIHSWAVPSFGFKVDAIPGRLNEMWFKAEREGVYYGQCSELCGNGHPYMPIAVRVVSEDAYRAWLDEAKKKFARLDGSARFAAVEVRSANH
jgi:cytochrome c oxidase subunit 2